MAHIIKTTFQFKRETAARWLEVNPILSAGEPGFETDTNKLKIGNGRDTWLKLPYIGENNSVQSNTFIYEITVNKGDNHIEAINHYLNGKIPNQNDIAIIKENIDDIH